MPVIENRKGSILVFGDIAIIAGVLNFCQQVVVSIYKVYGDLSLDRLPDFIQSKVFVVVIIASVVDGEAIRWISTKQIYRDWIVIRVVGKPELGTAIWKSSRAYSQILRRGRNPQSPTTVAVYIIKMNINCLII